VAGSNTSTVALRVVGGDEKGSLESETVKYGREPHATRTRERLRWRAPAAAVNDRPVLSSERERPTSRNPQLSDTKTNLVRSPRWVLYSKTDWPTDVGVNIRLRLRRVEFLDASLPGHERGSRELELS
jgi:hypothetical protein